MFTQQQKQDIKGAGVLVLTTFDKEMNLYCDGIRQNMAHIIAKGLTRDNGFFVTDGSMGECASLNIEERKQVIKTTVECAGNIPVIAGVNDTSAQNVIELTNYAKEVGAYGVLLTPPFYHTYSVRQVEYFYSNVHDRTNLPIMLYNNPMIAGVDLPVKALKDLAQLPRVFAIKQATLMTTNFVQSLNFTDELLFFAASSSQQPFGNLNGASGFISFLSSVNLPMQLGLWEAVKKEDWTEAMRYHRQELRIYDWWWNGGVEQPAGQIVHIKKAMDMIGLYGGTVRPPLIPTLSEAELQGLTEIMKEWKLL